MTTNKALECPSLEYYLSLKYPISIYPEEEGVYTVLIPDLKGCMTQGETLEEVVKNIEEARELWIETVYYSGKKEIPLPSKKRGFNIPCHNNYITLLQHH
ncbi:MAG: type II toxin-antitoxin system HicB family antitoxin [Microcystaceae cyanobacterium]